MGEGLQISWDAKLKVLDSVLVMSRENKEVEAYEF